MSQLADLRERIVAAAQSASPVSLPFELGGTTEEGRRLVRSADTLALDFAARASRHDRDRSFPFESVRKLREAGYFTAPIPVAHGGLGVTSVHDLVVASSRLARGDASVAIGVNMHLIIVANIVRRWQIAHAAGDTRRSAAFERTMQQISREGTVIAAAISENGQDLTRPATTAERTSSGWRIDGRKHFCTMAPAATTLYASVTAREEDGTERYAYAQIPADAAGVTIHHDWDGLGMRASGSTSITFTGVELPGSAVHGGFAVGDAVGYIQRNLTSGLFHAAASLGIAESAQATTSETLLQRDPRALDPRSQTLLTENIMDLSASRAALARAATMIDNHRAANPTGDGTAETLTALFSETQAVKTFVNKTAAAVVERALALSGGVGYIDSHPLARAYRDVRAGSFMHPLGANRAYEFISRTALGHKPTLN
jgi:alkylation response protein AidB-like acyl-CoA dehydrogenase